MDLPVETRQWELQDFSRGMPLAGRGRESTGGDTFDEDNLDFESVVGDRVVEGEERLGTVGCGHPVVLTRYRAVQALRRKLPEILVPLSFRMALETKASVPAENPDTEMASGDGCGGRAPGVLLRDACLARHAPFGQRARITARPTRSANERPELHQRLVEIGAVPPSACRQGRCGTDVGFGQGPEMLLVPRMMRRRRDPPKPGKDASHIAVHYRGGLIEGDGTDCTGCVASHPGQTGPRCHVLGPTPLVLQQDLASGFLKSAWPRIVAQASPESQELVKGGGSQGGGIGELRHPTFVIGDDCGDLGLLKHHLGDPDGVGITGASPGQVASGLAEVTQESGCEYPHFVGLDP